MAESPLTENKKWFWQRWGQQFSEGSAIQKTIYVMGGVVAFFLITLLLSVVLGLLFGESEGVASTVSIIRDLFIILLAMQGMLISLALVVLILQMATLINLLQNEVHPIVKNFQDATHTLKGTSEFLSENLTTPVIESKAIFTGVGTFMRELSGIRKALSRKQNGVKDDDGSAT